MRVLAIGVLATVGCGDDAVTPDALVDDSSNTTCAPSAGWVSAPAVGIGPTQETATVALDGKLYVIGGFDENLAVLDSVQVFDTATCAWSLGPALPRAVHHANAAVANGRIYVTGAMVTLSFTAIGDTWSWAPGEPSWTARASMPAGSERGAAVTGVIGERIYVAGGLRGGAVAQVSTYAWATDTWDAAPALPVTRDHGCGGVVAGTLYVTGGRAGSLQGEVYALAPGGAWQAKAPMPTARGGTACGVVGDRIIVVGGEGNTAVPSGVFPQVEAYAPASDEWAVLAPMVTPRHGMGAAAWNGSLYVPGGATRQGFGAVDTFEILTP